MISLVFFSLLNESFELTISEEETTNVGDNAQEYGLHTAFGAIYLDRSKASVSMGQLHGEDPVLRHCACAYFFPNILPTCLLQDRRAVAVAICTGDRVQLVDEAVQVSNNIQPGRRRTRPYSNPSR